MHKAGKLNLFNNLRPLDVNEEKVEYKVAKWGQVLRRERVNRNGSRSRRAH